MNDAEFQKFLNGHQAQLDNPFWVFDKNLINEQIAELTNDKSSLVKKSLLPKAIFLQGDFLSSLYASGATTIVSSLISMGVNALLDSIEKDRAKRIVKIYLIYAAVEINGKNDYEIVDRTAWDIAAQSFQRYSTIGDKKFKFGLFDVVKNSVKLLVDDDLSFHSLSRGLEYEVYEKTTDYIMQKVNLVTLGFILNSYYMFDISKQGLSELIEKYSHEYVSDLEKVECPNPDWHQSIGESYDHNRGGFMRYFEKKYGKYFSDDTISFILDFGD